MSVSPFRFQLLGPIAVIEKDREVAAGHPKQRSVLAALLVTVNQPVSTSALIDQIWGERPPPSARSALYTYIAHLRPLLSRLNVPIVRRSGGYLMEADPETVDLHRFRRLVGAAAQGEDGGALLDEAIGLWRGEPFEGLNTPWFNAVRAEVLAEHRAALVRRNQLLLTLGRHSELLPELLRATTRSPLDESLAAQLITALHRSGQRSSAIAHYHRLRNVLVEELGIDPSPRLQHLYRRILAPEPARRTPARH
jgi:DNA-binding SARP family transcriptional activator